MNLHRCSSVGKRYLSESTSTSNLKMHAKTVILNQWKLITELKTYFSKFPNDAPIQKALNKEFAEFLQKIELKTYGNDLYRYFSSAVTIDSSKEKSEEKPDPEKGAISFPNVFGNIWKEDVKPSPVPQWKINRTSTANKQSLISETNQVLRALALSETKHSKLDRIEELILHLKKYPEAKHIAMKEGGLRLLLRIQNKSRETEIKSALNEAFALLGYAHPVKGSGIRILSMDGGGTRGILVIEMLKKLEELSGKPIYEMFDMICGVSTGAIIGSLMGLKQLTLDEVSDCYTNLSAQVFTQSALKGTSSLVWSQSYYDTELWEKLLQKQWDRSLIETSRNLKCPKYCAVSAVVNHSRLSAYVFRNYALPCKVQSQYLGGFDHQVWEACRASAAAPTYFEEFKIGNMIHQDGGILVNNPTAVAIHEAKLLWPTTPIQCVVSFGTGRTVPNPVEHTANSNSNTSWKHKFFAILDSATDTEGVHTMLSDLLPEGVYYRFNPYLTEMLSMSEINPEKFEQLKRDAIMYLRRNEDKFQQAVSTLNEKKSYSQKCLDWFDKQKQMYV